MKTKDHSLILRRLIVLVLLLLTGAAIHKYLRAGHNNYLIFVMPFKNLLEGNTIYGPYPELYIDTYKYSPTFAWLMGLFYFLPVWLGALLWNSLNSVMLVTGLWYYLSDEKDADRARWTALLIVVAEALITTQNMQSNNLIVGAMLLGIYHLRRQHIWTAAFFFVLCGFVKFYGIGAAIFFLFYRRKPQFLLAMTVWTLVFALLPATIISFDALRLEYIRWFEVVVESKLGQLVSVLGILESWFGMLKTDANLRIVEAVGIVLFLLPFLRFSLWSDRLFQRRMVAYFLLFVIIFNKMAESPTYVLAVTGVALWWITLDEKTLADKILLGLVIVFTSLSPTDLFPKFIRNEFFVPYNVKAIPCVLVWLRLQWQLWTQVAAASKVENEAVLVNQPLES